MITYLSANAILVEEWSMGTSFTDILFPFSTKWITVNISSALINAILNACTINYTISIIASCALSRIIPSSAVITDSNTDFIRIENVSYWTLSTDVVCPIGASLSGRARWGSKATSICANNVAFIAILTNSNSWVILLALFVYRTADSVVIEDISLWAFGADSVSPGLTAKVIVDQFDKCRVIVFRT
jgi:hypothetical protein